MKIQGANAVSVHVNDLDTARKFYSNVFGLQEAAFMEDAGLAIFAVPNGTPLAVHDWSVCKENGARPPGTVSGIILSHDDPEAFGQHVADNGGAITDPPGTGPTGSVFVTVADPDGNEFIITKPNP